MMCMVTEILQKPKPVLGVLRLLPLPGSAAWNGKLEPVLARAEQEASALASGGVDALILENYYDQPYPKDRIDMAGAIAMAMIARRVKNLTHLPVGVSVLQNDPETALAIAMNVQAAFIRVPLLIGAMITESGLVEGRLNQFVEYRQRLQGELPGAKILADISTRHLLNSDEAPHGLLRLQRLGQALTRYGVVDALIVSDREIEPQEAEDLKGQVGLPLLMECQKMVDPLAEHVESCYRMTDGVILEAGIYKTSGFDLQDKPAVDMHKVEELVNHLKGIRDILETLDPAYFLHPPKK